MKKLFTLLFVVSMLSVNAQTYFSEDFEGGSLPMGWTQMSNATDGGFIVGTAADHSSLYFPVPDNGSTYMIGTNDDDCNCDKSMERLATPEMDLTDAVAPFLYYDTFFAGATFQGATESANAYASTDGGTTWTALGPVTPAQGWANSAIDISAYAGEASVMVSWVYDDGAGWLFGFMMDNVVVKEATQRDAQLSNLTMRSISLVGESITIGGTIANGGLETINTVDVVWNDGNGDQMETLSGLNLASFETMNFTHSIPYVVADGTVTIDVSVQNPNGMTDDIDTNNSASGDVRGVTPAPSRKVVIEEGTGTWCGWCPRGTVILEQMNEKYPDYFIGIAVHNGDPMVVTEYDDGLGITGFPNMSNERTENFGFGTIADVEERFLNRLEMAPPASLQSAATYDAATGEFVVTSEATSLQDASGNYRLAVVLTEDGVTGTGAGYNQANYYSGGGAGPLNGWENLPNPVLAADMIYDHVGMMLVGGFNGAVGSLPNSMATGDRNTWVFDPVTIPATSNTANIHVVTLLLNPQGHIVNAYDQTFDEVINNSIVGTKEVFAHDLAQVSPNPFSGTTYVRLNLETSTSVEMTVMNSIGQVVAQRSYGQLSGETVLPFEAKDLAEGMYYIHVKLDEQLITKKVTLTK